MFEYPQKVLFKHCDPAGIVFFPRYFEMLNDCMEAFFATELDWPWEALHGRGAVPTAQIETRFTAASKHGDYLILRLFILSVGRSSMSYRMTASCGDSLRFDTKATLVNVDADGRPAPWPNAIRVKLTDRMEQTT
jgi:4-hydroxybenzoyl-CoA thioesterase